MTLNQLQKICLEWQNRLALNEWKITLRYGTASELNRKGECYDGWIMWWTEDCNATIIINRKAKNREHVLLHELIHLILEGHLPATNDYNPLYERSINKIASALIKGNNE